MRITPHIDRLILHIADNHSKWGLGTRYHKVAYKMFLRGIIETLKDTGNYNSYDLAQLELVLKDSSK
jgi:hypothetical protein